MALTAADTALAARSHQSIRLGAPGLLLWTEAVAQTIEADWSASWRWVGREERARQISRCGWVGVVFMPLRRRVGVGGPW
jgi:hypothetical protein